MTRYTVGNPYSHHRLELPWYRVALRTWGKWLLIIGLVTLGLWGIVSLPVLLAME